MQSLEDFFREDFNVRKITIQLTTINDAPFESEDFYIVYCVAQQTRFEATAEQGFVVLLDCIADLHR
ncbi:unnamed protein product [Rotaria sordida]|uniref:Uncharacterized protein n=1 Tax=Rotaria sordida TaxID=392033 RepID=A0A814FYH6_9BILA|nr:unnamed protein product [Rotaria sordida]